MSLSFSQIDFELGTVVLGSNPEMVVTMRNNSFEHITVNIGNSSCSCTSGHMDNADIPSGEQGTLRIILDTSKAGTGFMSKSLNISWKEGNIVHNQTFRLTAHVSHK